MGRHRTTARGALLLLTLALCTGAASAASHGVDPIVFPIVGPAEYGHNYGDPRPNGRHAGIDIMTSWRSAAVAAEDGTVKLWTTSARAGCMLYLYGESGTTYLYIHLNNDLTARRDNRGSCVPGVAYAPGLANGTRVKAGQLVGYNGDSGDAEGTTHLHFEVHPRDGADVDPFPYLNDAVRALFVVPARSAQKVVLGLRGTPLSAGGGVLELAATHLRVWPGGRWTPIAQRSVELTVPGVARLDAAIAAQILSPTRRALASRAALSLTVFTTPAKATPEVIRGAAGALTVDRVQVAR